MWLALLLASCAALSGTACSEEKSPGDDADESERPPPSWGGGGSGNQEELGSGGATTARHKSSPAELAERSAENYRDNESGLIHPDTLTRWLADWEKERPSGIDGDLVILQYGSKETELPLSTSAKGVRTYLANDLPALLQIRLNALVAIGWSPARGVRFDSYLRRYRIDPKRDLVLLTSGAPDPEALAVLAQAWLSLRYWGFSHENLGLLHGNVAEDLPEDVRSATAPFPPIDGTHRVPALGRDQFSLLAHVGIVKEVIAERGFVLDVRSPEAFAGTVLSTSATDETCRKKPPHCSAVYGGKIPTAKNLPIEQLLGPDGLTLRPLDEIDAALASVGIDSNTEVLVYDGDGRQSAIAAFALLAVAGVPARWYASSFVEWGSLNASHPDPALRTLPEGSPWRTDIDTEIETWADLDTGIRPLIFNSSVTATDAVTAEDRAYLESPPILPGPADGASGCSVD